MFSSTIFYKKTLKYKKVSKREESVLNSQVLSNTNTDWIANLKTISRLVQYSVTQLQCRISNRILRKSPTKLHWRTLLHGLRTIPVSYEQIVHFVGFYTFIPLSNVFAAPVAARANLHGALINSFDSWEFENYANYAQWFLPNPISMLKLSTELHEINMVAIIILKKLYLLF